MSNETCDCCTPAGNASGCLICSAPVIYGAEQARECAICHKTQISGSVCAEGHYVCDACHAAASEPYLTFLRYTPERDPVRLLSQLMTLPAVHLHGPEHHRLVPAVLLAAYRNSGGQIDLTKALATAMQRAKQVPGGTCGYWGVCGAAAGAGIYASVVTGSSPLNRAAWPQPQQLTARILGRIAGYGGVRCCKRTAFLAVEEAAVWTRETLDVELQASRPVCVWSPQNRECLGKRCPYFRRKQEVQA